MPKDANRVAVSATTTGTGTITLAGAIFGHQTFATAYGTGGNTDVHYGIVQDASGEWEVGIGTFLGATNQLQRDIVLASSVGGSKVSFPSGSKTIYVPLPAEATRVARCRRATDVGMEVRAASGQTADLVQFYNFAGTKVSAITSSGGVSLGSTVAPGGANDLSRHITLHGTAYGFNVTAVRLNYNVPINAQHDFYVGSVLRVSALDGAGGEALTLTGHINLPTLGALQFGSSACRIQPTAAAAQVQAFIGGTLAARIDPAGTASAVATTVVTREKGDVRYARADTSTTIAGNITATIGEFGSFYIGANSSGGASPTLISAKTGGAFIHRSGLNADAMHVFQDTAGTGVARVDLDDTAAAVVTTLITRRKGDARYAAISSERFKPDAAPVAASDITQIAVKGWTWGGDLDPTHPRYGRAGTGFIAEEVFPVLPGAVTYDADGNIEGLDALALVAHLAGHVAGLEARIVALEA